jgi:hypothetical protein
MAKRSLIGEYAKLGNRVSDESLNAQAFEAKKFFFQAYTGALGFEHMETTNPEIVEAVARNGQTLFYCSPRALVEVSELAKTMVKPIIISDFTGANLRKDDLNLFPKGAETYVLGEPTTRLKNIPGNIHFINNDDDKFLNRLAEELKPMTEQ